MLRKLGKFVFVASVILAVVALAAHLVWKYSGSNQWEPIGVSKKGVKLYALKKPGETVKQFKGVVRVRSTLHNVMAASQDPSICENVDCYESRMFERVSERSQYYTFRWPYPFGFQTREFVTEQRFSLVPAGPKSQALLVEVIATPDKLPPNDCCVRIETMHNTWKYTPVGNGELELEYVINMDDGGYFPYVLANFGAPEFIKYMLPTMQAVFDRQKLKSPNARFELVAGI